MIVFKMKVIITLSSGRQIEIITNSFQISKLSGSRGEREMTYGRTTKAFTIDIDNIVAVEVIELMPWQWKIRLK